MQVRRGSAAQWSDVNPTLDEGEPGFAVDAAVLKVGDGFTAWNDLPGGGAPSVRLVECDPLTPTTPNVTDGVPIYTPTPGEWLMDAWPVVDVGFDDDTMANPQADFALQAGIDANSGSGICSASGNAVTLSPGDSTDGSGRFGPAFAGFQEPTNDSTVGSLASRMDQFFWRPVKFVTADPLLGWISRDGNAGGDPTNATAGTLVWVLVIGTS